MVAHSNFHFIGTMNPGGDFGKKELSPALRNRFTEIWCESCNNRDDLVDIINHNIKLDLKRCNVDIGILIMDFIEWFRNEEIGKRYFICDVYLYMYCGHYIFSYKTHIYRYITERHFAKLYIHRGTDE